MTFTPRSFVCMIVLVAFSSNLFGQNIDLHWNEESKFGEDKSVIYKECDGEDLGLYLFLPESSRVENPKPTIIFFFGGGWVGGSPKQFGPQAKYLASRGMIAVLADYRTKKSHGTTPKECVADAKSAVRFLRSNAKTINIDPKRIVAAGGSAGGHIAAATATISEFNENGEDINVSAVPNALALFNPVYNNGPGEWGHKTVKAYWQQISPAHNIQKEVPPTIVFLGSNDKLVSVATAKDFQDKMKSFQVRSDLHIYEGSGHGFFNYGRSKNKAFIDTVEKLDRFLVELGYLRGKNEIREFLQKNAR